MFLRQRFHKDPDCVYRRIANEFMLGEFEADPQELEQNMREFSEKLVNVGSFGES
jgi:hypothetical protein